VTKRALSPGITYRDGVGVTRCRRCLQAPDDCYCKRPYWCTWCSAVDGTKFLPTDARCCAACLALGRTARTFTDA
jgi:hypothetical protein